MADSLESGSERPQEAKDVCENLTSNIVSKTGNGTVGALLVEEYPNMSPAMQNLMSSLENPTIEEILVVLLYILIVESGFVPFPSDPVPGDGSCSYNAQILKRLSACPKNWRDVDGVFRIYFSLASFSEEKCKLICVPVGSCFVANMYSTCCDRTFALVINPTDYVALYPDQIIFKKLKNLSYNFKNQVAIPARTVILNEVHQTSVGLFTLPVEVLLKIIKYLRVGDFLKWTSTCKYFFHTFSYDEHIWKRYCELRFSRPVGPDLELLSTSIATYREYYHRRITLRNRVSNF